MNKDNMESENEQVTNSQAPDTDTLNINSESSVPAPEAATDTAPPDSNAHTTPASSDPQPTVVSSDDQPSETVRPQSEAPAAGPTQSATAPQKSKRGLFVGLFIALLVITLAAVGYIVTKPAKTAQSAATIVKKDIPVLQVAAFQPLPHTYYPNIQNDTFQQDITMQLFETLTKFVNGTTLAPGLADSWTNPDSSTWVFKLHPGVKFHTGKTLTASDVKASLDAAATTDYGKIYASTIKSVTVVDPLTVKITTNGPDPILANELSNLYIYDTTSGKTNDAINGSGPYTLKSDSSDAIKLTAFDNYWGGHVYTREVDYLGYQDVSAIPTAELQNRQVQVLAVSSQPTVVSKLVSYGYADKQLPAYVVGHLVFNTLKAGSPFANLKVRQAVAQAIDTKAIIDAAAPGSLSASQTVPDGIPGYDPSLKAVTFSTANAKAALAAAGYPNGFSFKLTYYPPAQAVAQTVQKDLAAISVTVNLDPESDQHTLAKLAIGGGTDMYYSVVSSSYVDASDILSDFIDSANYSNAALDKLNTQASQELNPAKRVAILQQMSKTVHDDQADIPLFQRQAYILAYDPNVVLMHDTVSTTIGTYFWQTYAK